MSDNCVPPARTSPYQNGAGASAKAASLKFVPRHAVVSGRDASFVPRRNRQVELKGDKTADSALKVQHSSPSRMRRVIMGFL